MKQLSAWLEENYIKRAGMKKSDAVKAMSEDLNASYSTVYKWLKDGDCFVDIPESGVPGDEPGHLFLFKQIRSIEP